MIESTPIIECSTDLEFFLFNSVKEKLESCKNHVVWKLSLFDNGFSPMSVKIITNSSYMVTSEGKNLGYLIPYYDVIMVDLEYGEPNSKHYLWSEDVFLKKLNLTKEDLII